MPPRTPNYELDHNALLKNIKCNHAIDMSAIQLDECNTLEDYAKEEWLHGGKEKALIDKKHPSWSEWYINFKSDSASTKIAISARKLASACNQFERFLESFPSHAQNGQISIQLKNFGKYENVLVDVVKLIRLDMLHKADISETTVESYLHIARTLECKFLLALTNKHYLTYITPSNAMDFVQLAQKEKIPPLFTKAQRIIAENLEDIVQNEAWKSSTSDQLYAVVSNNTFKINLSGGETRLYEAVREWLQAQQHLNEEAALKILKHLRLQFVKDIANDLQRIQSFFKDKSKKTQILEYVWLCVLESKKEKLPKTSDELLLPARDYYVKEGEKRPSQENYAKEILDKKRVKLALNE